MIKTIILTLFKGEILGYLTFFCHICNMESEYFNKIERKKAYILVDMANMSIEKIIFRSIHLIGGENDNLYFILRYEGKFNCITTRPFYVEKVLISHMDTDNTRIFQLNDFLFLVDGDKYDIHKVVKRYFKFNSYIEDKSTYYNIMLHKIKSYEEEK